MKFFKVNDNSVLGTIYIQAWLALCNTKTGKFVTGACSS